MTESPQNPEPGPEPRPFHPEAVEAPPWHLDRKAVVGCGGGCLVLLGLFVVLMVALVVQGGSMLGLALNMSRDSLRSEVPEGWTDDEQRSLDAAFERAEEGLLEGQTSAEDLEELQGALIECLGSASRKTLSREQLERLRRALDAVALSGGDTVHLLGRIRGGGDRRWCRA